MFETELEARAVAHSIANQRARHVTSCAVLALVLCAGCNLKFPGPHFTINVPNLPDGGLGFAGFGGGFAGSGGGTPGQSRQPQVIAQAISVSGNSPVTCPAGQMAASGTCRLRNGTPKQCTNGGAVCANGECCAAGFACAAGGGCERSPGGGGIAQPGFCSLGQLITSTCSNCPAFTPATASALRARCCPVGSTLHCSNPNDATTAMCAQDAYPSPSCPQGYVALSDNVTGNTACCLANAGSVELSGGICMFSDIDEPSCSGTSDPATGNCCDGELTPSGRCCAAGHAACSGGCCELGESCDSATGQCRSAQSAGQSCPAQAPVDCSSSGGGCCPADSHCQANGTCSCPAATPVDCGGFCAASTQQCSCPADHPAACGASCCLAGGCGAGGAPPNNCGCPSGTTGCGQNCCPSSAQCVNGQCLQCPQDAPTHCGNVCCGASELCQDGACVVPTLPMFVPSSGPDAGTGIATVMPSTSSGGSGGQCMTVPVPSQCTTCSVKACASGSSASSCQAWYDSSDGRRFDCASCADCSAAAQNAVVHCCPLKF